MVEDLRLDGVQWNVVLSVFFVPYVLLEVPSNMLLKRFKRPSVYLGILIVCWGIIMTMMGVVKYDHRHVMRSVPNDVATGTSLDYSRRVYFSVYSSK